MATVIQRQMMTITTVNPYRVAEYQADMALNMLPLARANADAAVITACVRTRQAWLNGGRVLRSTLNMVEAFYEASREG